MFPQQYNYAQQAAMWSQYQNYWQASMNQAYGQQSSVPPPAPGQPAVSAPQPPLPTQPPPPDDAPPPQPQMKTYSQGPVQYGQAPAPQQQVQQQQNWNQQQNAYNQGQQSQPPQQGQWHQWDNSAWNQQQQQNWNQQNQWYSNAGGESQQQYPGMGNSEQNQQQQQHQQDLQWSNNQNQFNTQANNHQWGGQQQQNNQWDQNKSKQNSQQQQQGNQSGPRNKNNMQNQQLNKQQQQQQQQQQKQQQQQPNQWNNKNQPSHQRNNQNQQNSNKWNNQNNQRNNQNQQSNWNNKNNQRNQQSNQRNSQNNQWNNQNNQQNNWDNKQNNQQNQNQKPWMKQGNQFQQHQNNQQRPNMEHQNKQHQNQQQLQNNQRNNQIQQNPNKKPVDFKQIPKPSPIQNPPVKPEAKPPPMPNQSTPIGPTAPESNNTDEDSLESLQKQLGLLETQIKNYQVDYQKWHQDFVKWQKEHQNHPDQKQYIDYQKKYQKMIEDQQGQLKQQYAELQKKIAKRKADTKKKEQNSKASGAAKIAALGLKTVMPATADPSADILASKKAAGASKIAALGLGGSKPPISLVASPKSTPSTMQQRTSSIVTSSSIGPKPLMATPITVPSVSMGNKKPTPPQGANKPFQPTRSTLETAGAVAKPIKVEENATPKIEFSSQDILNIKALAELSKNSGDSSLTPKQPPSQTVVGGGGIKPRPSIVYHGVRCKFFPKCSFGSSCKYEHPLCLKATTCDDEACMYEHPIATSHPPPARQESTTNKEPNLQEKGVQDLSRKRELSAFLSSTQDNESASMKQRKLSDPDVETRVNEIYEKRKIELMSRDLDDSTSATLNKEDVIGTISDPDYDIYEQRRKELLQDPMYGRDRFLPTRPRDPYDPYERLPPVDRYPPRDPYYRDLRERDRYRDYRDPLLDPLPPPPVRMHDPYDQPPPRGDELLRRERDIYGPSLERDRYRDEFDRRDPYDRYLPPPIDRYPPPPVDRGVTETIDYGHGKNPYPVEREQPIDHRERSPIRRERSPILRERSPIRREPLPPPPHRHDPPPADIRDAVPLSERRDRLTPLKKESEGNDGRRRLPKAYDDYDRRSSRRDDRDRDRDRDRRSDRDRNRDRRSDSYERGREERDRFGRDRSGRYRESERDKDRDRYGRGGEASNRPSDFLRRMEERERERLQRDSERDYALLYENRSPTRPSSSSVNAPDDQRIPEYELKPEVVAAADVLDQPGRITRPSNIVIILRGIPGSGKSFIAKLIKEKEAYFGAQPPRILALDDYFMAEKGEYVFEKDMEEAYRSSLLKAFNKTLTDGFFPMVIVDAINDKTKHFDQFWSDAKHQGFEVYLAELTGDLNQCLARSVHKRPQVEVEDMLKTWEKAPVYYKRLDVSSMLQDAAIDDVEMEEAPDGDTSAINGGVEESGDAKEEEEDEELPDAFHIPKSKWESSKEETLAKLDGFTRIKEHHDAKKDDDIDEDDDDPYGEKEADMRLGKKRVRWKDLEEKKHIDHQRKIGFSIGMDWKILTDPNAQIPK